MAASMPETDVCSDPSKMPTRPILMEAKKAISAGDDEMSVYEEMFKERYTDEDKSYVESIAKPISDPPAVHPWYNKSKRNFDYGNNRRGRGDADHHHHQHYRGRWSGNRGHHNQGRHASNNNYYKDQQARPIKDNRFQPY